MTLFCQHVSFQSVKLVPRSLSGLSNLVSSDLWSNDLTGGVPTNFSQIPGFVSFNVSRNDLQGEIPLLGFDGTPFVCNPRLCGKPLKNESEETKDRKTKRLIFLIDSIASDIALGKPFSCFYIFQLLSCRGKLKEKASISRFCGSRGSTDDGVPKLVMLNDNIALAENIEATREFE
ncbi:hypothetical protein MLD38_029588 [Melastoma candidum]|uniref:Uncharacterized protein n=1 Tax=Melastoma candidum TaxID=119954 RepID=A0ACB9N5V3_9MYRT|nr:hypothetical protein MLD38_029588 [Melastoma candidum]